MKAKLFVNGFFLYFILAIIGSNLYLGFTALSFGNLSLILLTSAVFYNRKLLYLNEQQKKLFMPLVLFFAICTFYFVTAFDNISARVISKYFYLMTIPILFVMSMILGNAYGDYFFKKVYSALKVVLLLMLAVVFVELVFNIHMPTHGEEGRYVNLPTAFFGNSNGLGTITVVIYILFVAFNEKYGNRTEYYFNTAIAFFLVIVTFSRMSVFVMVLFFPFYFVFVRHKTIRYIFIILIVVSTIIFVLGTLVDTYVANRDLDLFGWINNRLLSITDERTYDVNASNSFAVRYEIYSYPFSNPAEFVIGYGLMGDEQVLERVVRWSGITNAHSFFVESIYDFGWLGFFLIVFFFVNIFLFLARKNLLDEYRFAIIYTSFFMLLINVSSSIVGKPITWAPLFIYLAYLTSQNKTVRKMNR